MSDNVYKSIIFTTVSIIGSFLAIMIATFKLFILSDSISFSQILRNGDTYIICASMAITSIYSLYTFKKEIKDTKWPSICFWISIANYTIALLFYIVFSYSEATERADTIRNYTSLIIFAINIIIVYTASYYQNIQSLDIITQRATQVSSLEGKLTKMLGE